ncbi:MAG TPA: ABC transporter permease [Alphaproteobacteria bacterium]|nr:ABC transporter permease [Alphaproteobacteria bacterium]
MRGRIALGPCLTNIGVALVCAYLVLPTLAVIPVSFTATDYITFPPQGFSLRWYLAFVAERAWRNATLTSVLVALASTASATTIGTLAAFGLRRLTGGLARFAIWIFLLPIIVPSIIIAVALYGAFAGLGIVGTRLGLVLAHTIITFPFVLINVSAVLQKMDWRIVDAARSLGANPRIAFWKVTLPAILPGVLAGAVFAFLTSFDEVVVALFISGVDSVTLPVQMWNGIRFEVSPAVAAASGILLVLSIMFLSAFSWLRRRGHRGRLVSST